MLRKLLEYWAIFTAPLVALQALWERVHHYFYTNTGIWPYGNPSMGGTFISLALVGTRFEWAAWIAALSLGRSTPIAVLLSYRILSAYLSKAFSWKGLTISLIVLCSAVAYFYGVPDGTGRFPVWKLYFNWWLSLPPHFHYWGIGFGKTAAALPLVQLMDALRHGVTSYSSFSYAHNDFLQALVEFGVLGISVFTLISAVLLWASPRKNQLLAVPLFVAMGSNFPWHFYPHVFLYWLWIAEGLCHLKIVVIAKENTWLNPRPDLSEAIIAVEAVDKDGVSKMESGLWKSFGTKTIPPK